MALLFHAAGIHRDRDRKRVPTHHFSSASETTQRSQHLHLLNVLIRIDNRLSSSIRIRQPHWVYITYFLNHSACRRRVLYYTAIRSQYI